MSTISRYIIYTMLRQIFIENNDNFKIFFFCVIFSLCSSFFCTFGIRHKCSYFLYIFLCNIFSSKCTGTIPGVCVLPQYICQFYLRGKNYTTFSTHNVKISYDDLLRVDVDSKFVLFVTKVIHTAMTRLQNVIVDNI